ncbi:diguanylate cyclase [Rhizobium sp. Root274]|uniref:putative bifunctional diguanylate cyclase/phosphodiesterase n=1 Tax=unclassified Rhizobium TaxID=2613769 RepID=UPI0007147D8F|nr:MULTISPECIES: EAL domain-containing protein [unclassified Rhizobium]KQW31283.1 diguanylate cyclase [Rhizobium sp. Root1240]KRD32829.1 diguanylate cyclase [Rhizobium sp. Root274]
MLLQLQNTILEKIATGQSLAETIDYLCREVEALAQDVVCSVLLLDEDHRLRHLAGPSLPLEYTDAIDGIQIGPGVGSCGTAAFIGRPVQVEDIETHPYWQPYKGLALPLGLKACWSTPIVASGKVLGTFAFYYRVARGPSDAEKAIVQACVHLCAIAMERDQRIADRKRMAETDGLTGLPNRSRFNTVLGEVAQRPQVWSLLLLDLDNLKMVNDTFGHGAGDDLIRVVAHRIAETAPEGMAFRLGGDEFAVIIPCIDTLRPADLAARLIALIKETADCGGHLIYPAVTMGGAVIVAGEGPDQVRQNADYALYHAKERARGRYVQYTPGLGTSIVERFRAVQEVGLALREDRISAHYQPVVELATGRIMGLESLCRMTTREGEILPAARFMEAMKDAHVGLDITDRMLERIASDCGRWNAMGLGFSRVGFNLTAADFYRGGLTRRLTETFARHNLSPSMIVAEVTESVYLSQKDSVVSDEIHALREAGIKVALDDFGTGFASLTHLLTVPIDIIKIDKCFVKRLSEANTGAVIIRGLLEIARGLGIVVVAEGIEERSQAEQLLSLDCASGQGYFFARPMSSDAIEALLRKDNHISAWSAFLLESERELPQAAAG